MNYSRLQKVEETGLELGPQEYNLNAHNNTVHLLQNNMESKNAFFSQIL